MEVEIKPICLEDRMKYIQTISANQKVNDKKFPWLIAIVAFLIGGGAVLAICSYKKKKSKEKGID